MVLDQKRRAVGTFSNRQNAEHALNELNSAGFPMDQICVIAKNSDFDARLGSAGISDSSGGDSYALHACSALAASDLALPQALGEAKRYASRFGDTEEGNQACAIVGSMLGAIGGCLVGLGILAVPGVGPLVAVGTSGAAFGTTLVGAGIGLVSGVLTEALAGLGLTRDRGDYSDRTCQSEYLVIVDGTDDEVCRAESILSRSYSSKVWVL